MNGLGELMPARCWQLNSPSNSFQSIFSFALHTSEEEMGQCTCDEVHRFLSPLQPSDQLFGDIFVYGNKEYPDALNHVQPSSNESFPVLSMRLLMCCLWIYIHTVHYRPPHIRPIDSTRRICGSVRGFVGLCKRPRKMFSDKLFSIPQSLLGRALYHAAWCITRSRCLFASLYLSHPPLFLHLSITLSACPFFPSVFSLSLPRYSATLSFTLPEMDPVLGQAVSDNGSN